MSYHNHDVLITIFLFLIFISGLMFTLTAIIYAITPAIKNIQGKCVFHFSLNSGLSHLVVHQAYASIGNDNACVIYSSILIFFSIATCCWMHLLTFNTWRLARNQVQISSIMAWYYTIGYGTPSLLISFVLLDVYYIRYFEGSFKCLTVVTHVAVIGAIFPILVMLYVSFYYLVDIQCHLQRMHKNNSESSTFKTIVYQCLLYSKLFAITGFPWILLITIILICHYTRTWGTVLEILVRCIWSIISVEGITFFILMVLLRKKLLRSIVRRKYFGREIFSSCNRNVNDSESEDIDEDISGIDAENRA